MARDDADEAPAAALSGAVIAPRPAAAPTARAPMSTLAMPSSITATLAAVPLAPFEKLRQMYSSITLEA